MRSQLKTPEETLEHLHKLLALYEEIEEESSDFMARQEASMKKTSVKEIIKDVKQND